MKLVPTSIKVVVPISAINGSKQLNPRVRTLDLGHAIRMGIVRLELVSASRKNAGFDDVPMYHLLKMPKRDEVQPQVYRILATLKALGGKASRARLVAELKKKLDTSQEPATVLSLKRKPMLEGGYIEIISRAA